MDIRHINLIGGLVTHNPAKMGLGQPSISLFGVTHI